MKISSIKDLETLLKVVYKRIPRAPTRLHAFLVTLLPFLSLAGGTFLITISCLPYFIPNYPLDPLKDTSLISLNLHLTRFVFILIGLILITSFNKLLKRSLVGWYNLFYATIFYACIVLVVFSPLTFSILLISWAYLFEAQSDFR